MNEQIKVCIADDNEDVAKNLAKCLSINQRIHVTDICKTGEDAVDSVLKNNIDILITDIIMPEIDGIGVIDEINKEFENGNINKKPNIIIVSALVHDNLKFDIFKKGVNYYMTKPINIDILQKRIIEIYDYDRNNEYRKKAIDEHVTKILYQIGIYPNLTGYKYVKKSIEILVDKPMINKDFRNHIYTVLAKEDNTEIGKVEKSIINAVNISWNKEKENVSKLLKNSRYHRRKPSTIILLTAIAEEIRNLNLIENKAI